MKIADFSKLLLLSLVLSCGATACKHTKGLTPIPSKQVKAPSDSNPADQADLNKVPQVPKEDIGSQRIRGNQEGIELTNRPTTLDAFNQDRETFKQDTIYFDFDKYNVKPGEVSKAQAVANYLKDHIAESVLVEGHCDERGTPEYNRALGERRALSVRELLASQGLSPDRIITLSYGEDRPADPGHDEAAWRKNRRAEFVLLHPKAGTGGTDAR